MTWGVDSAEKVSSGLIVYPHPLYVGSMDISTWIGAYKMPGD